MLVRPPGRITTSHLGLSPEQLETAGISEGLIRLSVGIEDAGDLVADLERAMHAAGAG